MSLMIDVGGEDGWELVLAPQQMTDVLVQVYDHREGHAEFASFTFSLGELIREEVEEEGCIDGVWRGTKERRDRILRWAGLLESYASIVRQGLSVWEEDKPCHP